MYIDVEHALTSMASKAAASEAYIGVRRPMRSKRGTIDTDDIEAPTQYKLWHELIIRGVAPARCGPIFDETKTPNVTGTAFTM
jgi:hypothetical protein